MAKKIRTGLIRCDTHGMWYGPLMADHDPLLFQRPPGEREKITYSWQTGGIHMFFYANYGSPKQMTVPFVGGFEIVKLWDVDRHAAEQAKAVFFDVPEICDTPDQCSDDVDFVFIGDCNFNGEDHLELAMPSLEKGVPTFVDKPFSDTVAGCRKMIETAKKKNTPLFSASILRFEPDFVKFRNRLPEIDDVNFATFSGYGLDPAGLVHTISATQLMFGCGISTVQVCEMPKQTTVWLDYDNNPRAPKQGVLIHTTMGTRPFTGLAASVFGSRTDIHTLVLGDRQYPHGTAEILRVIHRMLETGQTPSELDDMVEAIAVIQAAKKSQQTGQAERIEQFL